DLQCFKKTAPRLRGRGVGGRLGHGSPAGQKEEGPRSPGAPASTQLQGAGPAVTPWHSSSLVIQPASTTTDRLSLVMATGARKTEFISLPPGVVNFTTFGMASGAVPPASASAISAAFLPSSRASFQTETVCVPSAMRF